MTFQSSYEKLLTDPGFGTIKKRREHAKQMFVEGMNFLSDIALHSYGVDLSEAVDKAISEESK